MQEVSPWITKENENMKQYPIGEQEPQKVNESEAVYNVSTAPVFTSYQMQILDSIANVKDEHDMLEIRNLIAEYFSNKALDAMDKLCNEGKLSDQTIESWQTEHMRTPYTY